MNTRAREDVHMHATDPMQQVLADVLQRAAQLEGVAGPSFESLRAHFAEHAFNLVVAGEFKRGKSTFINALLGAEVLPMAVVPLTSIVTVLRYGEPAGVHVHFDNGDVREVALDALADYVTERGNPDNVKQVREVRVEYPAPWLDGGMRLVDTPGIGSVHGHNTETTMQYLPQADAVVLVVSADQPLSRAELDFLATIRQHAGKVFCLLNKIDQLSATERDESVAFVSAALGKAMDVAVPVFALSARQALQARVKGDAAQWQHSGLPPFDAAIKRFLREEGGEVWLQSMQRHLLRLLASARLTASLEEQALSLPLQSLDEKLQAFAQKKQAVLRSRADLDALLDADCRKLQRGRVESDLAQCREALSEHLQSALSEPYERLRLDGSVALSKGLEAFLVEEVRQAFDAWREREDTRVNAAFEKICDRFWGDLNTMVDELLRYAAELFSVSFDAVHTHALRRASAHFQYKFWQEPASLTMVRDGLIRLLPGIVGHPLILRQARRRARDLVNMQSGRLRHDFEQRIAVGADRFRKQISASIEDTVAGIETAIDKGRDMRVQGAVAVADRQQALEQTVADIGQLEQQLADGAEVVDG